MLEDKTQQRLWFQLRCQQQDDVCWYQLRLVRERRRQEDSLSHIRLIAGVFTNPQYINSLEHNVKTDKT